HRRQLCPGTGHHELVPGHWRGQPADRARRARPHLHRRAGGDAAQPALLRRRRPQHPRLRLARGRPAPRGAGRQALRTGREEGRHRQRGVRALLHRAVGRGGVRGRRQCLRQQAGLAYRGRGGGSLALAGRPGAARRRPRPGRPRLLVPALSQRRGRSLMAPVFRQPGPGEPTPEEREARIAELRLRRQARLRTLALRSVLVAGVLVLLLVVAGYWLLSTIGGRDFLMAQIVARLPADTTLTWERAEGPASGPLSLYDVRFSMPRQRDAECIPSADVGCESGTLEFFARRVMIDPALGPLLGKRLRLDALQVEGAHLLLPRTEAPFRLPEWPDVLPEIAPPLALQADDIQVDDFTVLNEDAAPGTHVIHVRRLRGGLLAEPGRLVLTAVGADTDLGRFTAQGEYAPGDDYRTDLLATAVFPAAAGRTPARLGLVARGDLSRMEVALAGRAPGELRATLVLGGGPGSPAPAGPRMASRDTPQWQLDAFADALDIGLLGNDPDAPPAPDPLQVRLHASGLAGDARIRGELRQGDFEVRLLPSRVHLAEQVIDVDPLELELLGGTLRVTGSGDFSEPGAGRFRAGLAARGLEWGGSAEAAPLRGSGEFGLSGVIDDWVVTGEARLERGEQQATVRIDGRGDSQRIDLPTLEVEMPGGALQGGGHVAWAPALGWDVQGELRGFDPGYFLPGWDGAIDGLLATTGE